MHLKEVPYKDFKLHPFLLDILLKYCGDREINNLNFQNGFKLEFAKKPF